MGRRVEFGAALVSPPRRHADMPSVSPIIIDSLRRRVDRVARLMTIGMGRAIPLGDTVPDGGGSAFGSEVLAACRDGLRTLLALWAEERSPSATELRQLARMGGRLATTGMPLDAILRAYRVAAVVIWQHVVETVRVHPEVAPQSVLTAVGPLFDYLDAISVAVSTSYLETRERIRREQDRHHDRVFAAILAGGSGPELMAQALAAGIALDFPYRVLAIEAGDTDVEATIATAWRTQRVHLVREQGAVVALVPAATKPETLIRLLGSSGPELSARPGAASWRVAIGGVAASLDAVAPAAGAARDALTVGGILRPGERVHRAAELHLYRVWLRDLPGLQEFVDATVGPLLERQRTRRLPLRETLAALLAHEGPSAAARSLGIHRHTLLYRMERIQALVGTWDEPDQHLRLTLGLQGATLLEALAKPDGGAPIASSPQAVGALRTSVRHDGRS